MLPQGNTGTSGLSSGLCCVLSHDLVFFSRLGMVSTVVFTAVDTITASSGLTDPFIFFHHVCLNSPSSGIIIIGVIG